jgi:CRP-like cAMP-binding protein
MSFPKILKQANIFATLEATELDLIASIAEPITVSTGDTIFEQGSASDELYVIISGEVDIVIDPTLLTRAHDQGATVITTLRRGQVFGEMALLSRGIRAASAICAQHDTTLFLIPRQALAEICEHNPLLGYKLMKNMAADLAEKIRIGDRFMHDRMR